MSTIGKTIAIIGAGPAGLMAAEKLAESGCAVTVYDQRPSPARKLLMAGIGGLNITHSESFDRFLSRYGEAAEFLRPALEYFTPDDLRAWCAGLGEETFVGSSGRVFPKSFKASPLLRAWLRRLDTLGVRFVFSHTWRGEDIGSDATILALGGASWPRLGSDGHWVNILQEKGIAITPFRPTNCGFVTAWSPIFAEKFAGAPVKSVSLTHQGRTLATEFLIDKHGVEGSGIYALSKALRDDIAATGHARLTINFKPDLSPEKICDALQKPRGRDSFSNHLRKTLHLAPVVIGLLQEDRGLSSLPLPELVARITAYPLTLTAPFPMEKAISTAGGIALHELDSTFQLKKCPHMYAIGEMLDWEAPTGGYLLQASFSMAAWVSHHLSRHLG